MFKSFAEAEKALQKYWEFLYLPKDLTQEGIHILLMYDDGQPSSIQHICAVVVGNFENKWEVHDHLRGRSYHGSDEEIITVAFKKGAIPFLIGGNETHGEVEFGSEHSSSCRCVRIEK